MIVKTVIRPKTEMKNSGIEYIGKIPNDWEVRKVGYLAAKITDYVASGSFATLAQNVQYLDEPDYARLIRTVDLSGSVNKQPVYVSKEAYKFLSNSNLFGGELILPNIGSVGCVYQYKKIYEHATLDPNSILLDMKENNRFYFYWFSNPIVGESLKILGNSTVQVKFNKSQLRQYMLPRPPLSEQQAIADYLDKTCSKIDEIIAEAKASIDEYKELKQSVIDKAVLHGLCNGMMKDSGNDLIGKIPLSWEMRKLKYVADFNPGITTAYDAQKEVGYVPMNCVKNGYMNPLSARLSDMSTGLTGFQDGDIVIAKVTPCFENGNIAVAENLEQGVAFGSSELFVIRTHSINRRFMLYYLQNSVFKNQCISTMTGTGGLKRVSGYFVNNAYITYPPENEQQVIVNYLDEAVKNMDSLITEKESLINDLEAYKKSLIYEVVTGKRRVV